MAELPMFGAADPMIAVLLRFLLLEPTIATVVGAWLAGEPQLAPELLEICRRESHCRFVGAHVRDKPAGPRMLRAAVRVGWLDPGCPFIGTDGRRFSTRGVHGLSAAYSLRFLGDCVPPEALDVPLLSAVAAARRSRNMCDRHRACTQEARHRRWVGAGKYDRATRRP